ncbi:MAG: diacylglycerol kinase family protein [Paeniclostridium sp.]
MIIIWWRWDYRFTYKYNKKLEIDIPIGILPSGTANDFANAINYPHDVKNVLKNNFIKT